MLYALDAIVNQAAKWSHMFGGQDHPSVTIRGIINRGGSRRTAFTVSSFMVCAYSWIEVVMPSTPSDTGTFLLHQFCVMIL